MTKKKVVKKIVEEVKRTDPKIHFSKYAAKNSVSGDTVAVMSIRNPREKRTEREWKELIKREFSRKIT